MNGTAFRYVGSGGIADERQLRLLMRDWRGGRATRSLWDVLSDGYVALFTAVVIGAMTVSALMSLQQSSAGCVEAGCLAARLFTPWLVLTSTLLIAMAASRVFGPLVASSAEGFWLMEAPIRRERLLVRRLWAVVILAFCGAAPLGLLAGLLAGNPFGDATLWAAASGLSASAVTAFAASQQSQERSLLLRVVHTLVSLFVLSILILVIASSAGWVTWQIKASTSAGALWGVIVTASVISVLSGLLALSRLSRLRRRQLVSGGALVESVQGAAFALDFGLLRDILRDRRWREIGNVSPQRGRGLGAGTLIWRDIQRLRRNPRPLIVWLVSMVIPYALAAFALGEFASIIISVVLFFVMVPVLDSLRTVNSSRGLERCFPMSRANIRDALIFVPSVLTGLWSMGTLPAFIDLATNRSLVEIVLMTLATSVAGMLAAVRWVTGRPVDYATPMLSTAGGAIPPGMVANLFKGFDIVALVTLPIVLRWTIWIPVAVCAISWMILRVGGINMAELAERSEEAKKELEAERARANALAGDKKIAITRSENHSSEDRSKQVKKVSRSPRKKNQNRSK